MRKRTHSSRQLVSRVHRQAEQRAAEAARCVPWPVLLDTRNQYLEWQEFYFWARSIVESEEGIPVWLAKRFIEVCPGFTEAARERTTRKAKDPGVVLVRLGKWIDQQVFGFAERAGWLPAVTYYAVRESRYQRASVCWSESVRKWRTMKPQEYPSLDEWLHEAARCDESSRLEPEIQKQRECFKLVAPARLSEAVSRYIEWEALSYWARAGLDRNQPPPARVSDELEKRCPGFSCRRAAGAEGLGSWNRLMSWIGDHFFQEAKAEGWYEAVVLSARMHPRAIRTMEYADHCDECWNDKLPVPYPSFKIWRKDADLYVAL